MEGQPAPGTVPPAFTPPPNGHGPTARLIEALPQMLYGAVSAAIRQERAAPLRCATCMVNRLQWGSLHAAAFAAAEAAYKTAADEMAGRAPEDQAPLNPQDFIPAHLRPGGAASPPPIADGAVMIGGTLYCPQHIPGAPGMPGKSPLLIAQAHLTPGMLAGLEGRAA